MLKTQKTLDDFYKNTKNVKNNSEIKKYFYLIWENKFVPNVDAYWCDERPKKINFIEQVQCNYIKNGLLSILSNMCKLASSTAP